MSNHLLIIFSSVLIYESLKFFKLLEIIKQNLRIYQKIIRLFKFKKASDLRKEKLILNYSKSLFIISTKIFAILISIVFFILSMNLFFTSFLTFIVSIIGIIELSLVFITYHLLRRKIYEKL